MTALSKRLRNGINIDAIAELMVVAAAEIELLCELLGEVASAGVETENNKYYCVQIDRGTLETIKQIVADEKPVAAAATTESKDGGSDAV